MSTAAFSATSKKSARTVPDVSKTTMFGNFLKCNEVFKLYAEECFVNKYFIAWPR